MDKTPKEYRCFFKVFVPERNGRILKIPTAYTRNMNGNLPAKVFLKDRYGNLWTVDIETIQNELYFVGGWSKFVQDNSLEAGDFLVFYYDGFDVLEVKLMGNSYCEKEGVGVPRIRLQEEEQEYLTEDEDQEEEYTGSEDIEVEVEEKDKESSESTRKDDDDDDDDDEIPKSRDVGCKHLKIMNSARGESSAGKDKAGVCKKRAAIFHSTEIFKSGSISPPKNPYFVTKKRQGRRDELFVPTRVIKDCNLDLPPEMTLRDSAGREWLMELTPWKDGRMWYCGGWRSLCRLNGVQDTDSCICEFVRRKDKKQLEIQVTIVRNN